MIRETELVALPVSVDTKVLVEVEQKADGMLVIDLSPSIGLLLGDDLAHVLANQLVFVDILANKEPPAGNLRFSNNGMLGETKGKREEESN